MGASVSFAGSRKQSKKTKKAPKDNRRRNSLAFFLTTYLRQEHPYDLQVEAVKRDIVVAMKGAPDPRNNKQSRVAEKVSQGNMKAIREQVINQWRSINRPYRDQWKGETLLHICCREGYARMVDFMLDPKNRSAYDDSPLELNEKNDKGRLPLWLVFTPPTATIMGMQHGLDDTGQVLRVKPPDIEFAADWVQSGSVEDRLAIAKYLIDAGADLLQTDYHEFSVLHFAVMWGWKDTAELILDKTGDALLNATTMFGRTPLHFAVEFGHAEIVKMLLARDAMVNAADRDGFTPVLCACENNSLQITQMLLEHDADVTAANSKGKTTLKLACEHNNEALVNLLLDHKVKRRGSAFSLLQDDVFERISQRIIREEEEVRAAAKAAEEEAKRQAAVTSEVNMATRGYSHRSPYGQWVPYKDRRTKKVFYYNKVSRVSQWDRPPDYVHDATHLTKEATFGMSFYH